MRRLQWIMIGCCAVLVLVTAVANSQDSIHFNPTGNWTFPTGMVWVKHFEMEMHRGDPTSRRRLETRFLMKTADGVYGVTYRWRPDQSDADLVPEEGADEPLTISVNGASHMQSWHYPSRSECSACHTAAAGGALGFNTFQLNGVGTGHENQIEALSRAGYLDAPVSDIAKLPALAKATDKNATIEWRVRSYLAANCVQCHQPGAGSVGRWDARPATPIESANLINGILVEPRGDPMARWAVPHDTAHSMVLQRLTGVGAPRMPPLASNETDPAAIKLMQEWIAGLPDTKPMRFDKK